MPELVNNTQILNLSKEDTILIYEQRAISDTFWLFAELQESGCIIVQNVCDVLADILRRRDGRTRR